MKWENLPDEKRIEYRKFVISEELDTKGKDYSFEIINNLKYKDNVKDFFEKELGNKTLTEHMSLTIYLYYWSYLLALINKKLVDKDLLYLFSENYTWTSDFFCDFGNKIEEEIIKTTENIFTIKNNVKFKGLTAKKIYNFTVGVVDITNIKSITDINDIKKIIDEDDKKVIKLKTEEYKEVNSKNEKMTFILNEINLQIDHRYMIFKKVDLVEEKKCICFDIIKTLVVKRSLKDKQIKKEINVVENNILNFKVQELSLYIRIPKWIEDMRNLEKIFIDKRYK